MRDVVLLLCLTLALGSCGDDGEGRYGSHLSAATADSLRDVAAAFRDYFFRDGSTGGAAFIYINGTDPPCDFFDQFDAALMLRPGSEYDPALGTRWYVQGPSPWLSDTAYFTVRIVEGEGRGYLYSCAPTLCEYVNEPF